MTTMLRVLGFLSWLTLFAGAVPAQSRAEFRFQFAAGQERAKVQVRYEGCEAARFDVAMPAWKPGSYTIHDFGKNVVDIHAHDGDGKELTLEGDDPNAWHIHADGAKTVVIDYELVTRPKSGFGPGYSLGKGLGPQDKPKEGSDPDAKDPATWQAYGFEGPACWLYVPGKIGIPHRVTFDLPADWDIATGLQRVDDEALIFEAPDYDVFADCPFHVGHFERKSFDADGARYEIVMSGFAQDRHDRDEIVDRYRRIVAAHHAMWGKPPYSRYVFLIGYPGGGGLEHLNSCDMGMMDLSGSEPGKPSAWDSLVSHEFFHCHNVKRLRPEALGPFDYSGPNRTKFLWLSEGVTSYYGDVLLVRAGIWDADHFWLNAIGDEIRTLQANPGRLKMSIAEASWTVWDAPYMRRGRTAPDYYNKGELLGLLLDIAIRDATDDGKSFDDVMRALYEQCMSTGKGFADGDVAAMCSKVAGKPMDEFFAKYVDGVEELPFAEMLAKIGIRFAKQEAQGDEAEQGNRRRRREAIRLEFDPEAGERAQKLRAAITAPIAR